MGWKRHKQRRKKLKKLYNEVKHSSYPRPVYYDKEKEIYVRQWQNKGLKHLANHYNRRVRRTKNEIPDGGYAKNFKGNAKWNFW